jgi:hypothetical protein
VEVETISNGQGHLSQRRPSPWGVVVASVHLPTGEPAVRYLVTVRPVTPTEVRSDASYTNPSGTLHLTLLPGTYVLNARGVDDSGGELQGNSAEVTVEARHEQTVEIVVR